MNCISDSLVVEMKVCQVNSVMWDIVLAFCLVGNGISQPCSIELRSKYQISLLNYAKIFFSALSAEVQ